ncbi:MAG: hypothetical protein ABIM99_05935 [Candidatus Dojkabacteria bacterium]
MFSLDTSRPFSEAQKLNWTPESGATPWKRIHFEDSLQQYIYRTINESLGQEVTKTVQKMEFDGNTYLEVTTDYYGFINKTIPNLIPSFDVMRKNISIELQGKEESEVKTILNQFDTLVDLINTSKKSLNFNEYYYHILIEFYDYSAKHLKDFSFEFLSSFIVAAEIKKKILERLESQDKN